MHVYQPLFVDLYEGLAFGDMDEDKMNSKMKTVFVQNARQHAISGVQWMGKCLPEVQEPQMFVLSMYC